MSVIQSLIELKMTRTKIALALSFSILLLGQIFLGFQDFEDYLIVFIFVLFLNDLYAKIKQPSINAIQDDKYKRLCMTGLFISLFILALFLDAMNVSNTLRLFIFRLGFVLWAQVFLLDAFLNYRQTQSRKWLLITNMAALLIIVGAFLH